MAGTISGNKKVKQKMLSKYGGCEAYDACFDCTNAMKAYRKRMSEIGAKGGRRKVKKGVAIWRWGQKQD